ncbi:hypothetical protein G6D98_001819 [Salmonella bongori]|nr:hypothetical protein [Salmonella bongori]EDP8658565.1 hypothetical protein [Salmonella bongori]EEU7166208.1 hypothetical protein [Salmonella bongori]EIU0396254.1 hypothetical protein [Salmonella bongori]HDJ2741437.1 hypothetical protein [Salmonella bongori]
MKNRILLPLLLLLSATAFSASAMAASDTKDSHEAPKSGSGWSGPASLIHQTPDWCKHWPSDIVKPPFWCQMCIC